MSNLETVLDENDENDDGDDEIVAKYTVMKIAKNRYRIKAPYSEGHVLTVAEANALNRYFAECIANSARALLIAKEKKNEPLLSETEMQAYLDKQAEAYKFGRGNARISATDPVEREFHTLIRDNLINPWLNSRGIPTKGIGQEQLDALLKQFTESANPAIIQVLEHYRQMAVQAVASKNLAKTLNLNVGDLLA